MNAIGSSRGCYRYHDDAERVQSVRRNIGDLFSGKFHTLLYVGARTDRFDFSSEYLTAGYSIDVLEVWERNAEYLRGLGFLNQVYCGDVRQCEQVISREYDVVFWWHGPEHIRKEELPDTLQALERLSKSLVILGVPYGERPQGHLHGNPYEEHLSAFYPDDFHALGYSTETLLGYRRGSAVSRALMFCESIAGRKVMRRLAGTLTLLNRFFPNVEWGGIGKGSNILSWKRLE